MSMIDLNQVLKEFDNTSANLAKLEKFWKEMKKYLDYMIAYHTAVEEHRTRYQVLTRDFENIRQGLPKIDGQELTFCVHDYDSVFENLVESLALDEPAYSISFNRSIYSQEEAISKYKYDLIHMRRQFVKINVQQILTKVHGLLEQIKLACSVAEGVDSVKSDNWTTLFGFFQTLDRLLGDSIKRPAQWSTLFRHLHFGLKCDLDDIISADLPAIEEELQHLLLGENEPLPVTVKDLGAYKSQAVSLQPVSVRVNWSNLTPELFERLCQDIFSSTRGWQNSRWLLKTNASDRGRDIEVERVEDNLLTGLTTKRVIVQCKHYPNNTVGIDTLSSLIHQVKLHGRVDELIVVTSGKFSDQAVQMAEENNKRDQLPIIMLWNDWHLEHILAQRPDLTAQYNLF